ncbi:aconitate hydratase [Youngiibacter fragilis]|nr:aconitate hydratase [Youngiibacter fragilis]
MGLSITSKILKSHLIEGNLYPGEQVLVSVDQTLGHDLTGIMAAQVLESVQPEKLSTEVSVFYCDHNTLAVSSENADDHMYLKTAAERYGVYFSKPGNGICHFLHCQRFAKPGKIMLGADSHTPTSGALGMLSIGSGGLTVAKGMLGEGFRMTTPKVINIRLTGRLNPGVAAKDIALEALRILTVKGGIGAIIEYTGEGVKTLSVPERATLANMSIELGATTGIFPSDEVTYEYMKAQEREDSWIELLPDEDAAYDRTIEIDLGELEPLVARPHMPDLVSTAREVSSVRPNSVFIGSCTNASYSDILKASKILKGHKVHKDIDLTVAPGSKQVLEHLIKDGVLADLVESGARILECACGPCIGIGQVPCANGIAVRTSNRNFPGRSGSQSASVYLASPETAAATAITGHITDVRDMMDAGILADCSEPVTYKIDDSSFIRPEDVSNPKDVKVIKGENISDLPMRGALRDRIEAVSVIKLGDNITTDDIIPGGSSILQFIANIPKFAEFTFCYTDETFVDRIKKLKNSVIIGGENYGQGSSREHAAMLPMYFGTEVVFAKSFARIHKENLINYGILPLVFKDKEDYDRIDMNDTFVIENVLLQADSGEVTVKVPGKGLEFKTALEVSPYDLKVLKEGGALNYLRNK